MCLKRLKILTLCLRFASQAESELCMMSETTFPSPNSLSHWTPPPPVWTESVYKLECDLETGGGGVIRQQGQERYSHQFSTHFVL